MARGPLVTRQERERIIELLAQGKSRNSIMRSVKRSGDTVTRIAAEHGHVFGQSNDEKAQARRAYCAEVRERLRLGLLAEGERLLNQLREPALVYSFGGKENTYAEHTLDEPEPKAKQQIMTSIGIAIDKAEMIDKNNATGDDHGKGAMLALFEAMGVKLSPPE